MSGPREFNWEALGQMWREQQPTAVVPHGLMRRVQRHTLLMQLTVLVEVALFAGLAAVSRWYLADGASAARISALAVVWLLNAGFEVFSIWNRRGSWRADAETNAGYLDLIHRRARAKVRAARFVRVASAMQAVAVVALVWIGGATGGTGELRVAAVMAVGFTAGYGIWAAWYERRALNELGEAAAARRIMEAESGGV